MRRKHLLIFLFFMVSVCFTALCEQGSMSYDNTVQKKDDYEYVIDENGNAKLISYSWNHHKNGADIILPSEIDGHPVTAIGTHCFASDSNVEVGSFVIPDTVTVIEQQALYKLKINNIMLPKEVDKIAHGAIVTNYRTISLAKDNTNYAIIENALYGTTSSNVMPSASASFRYFVGGISRIPCSH